MNTTSSRSPRRSRRAATTTTRTLFRIMFGSMLLAAVAACSSSGGTAAPTDTAGDVATASTPSTPEPANPVASAAAEAPNRGAVDECAAFSAADVESVVGNPVAEGAADVVGCTWTGDPNDTNVSVTSVPIEQDLCASALETDDLNRAIDGFPVPAFWSYLDMGGGAGSISFCRETGTMLIVTVSAGLDDEPSEDTLLGKAGELGRLALERI